MENNNNTNTNSVISKNTPLDAKFEVKSAPTASAVPSEGTTTPTKPTEVPTPTSLSKDVAKEVAKEEIKLPDTNRYQVIIDCCIRRKSNLVGLPGQDPNERIYKIGSSLDTKTRSSLKGVTGVLEERFMPEMIGLSSTDPAFRRAIDEYWSGISREVPADEPFLKDYEKGIKLNLLFIVRGKTRKENIDKAITVEDKIRLLDSYLSTKDEQNYFADIDYTSVSDYLLLKYCLVYSKVANSFKDIDKSPKIDFYIFEKAVAVSYQMGIIEAKKKAMDLYQSLIDDERRLNSVLLSFKVNPDDYQTEIDKALKIDELYNASISNLHAFISYAEDDGWEDKLLINQSVAKGKLRNPTNSTIYYYGDVMLGLTLDEAVAYLNQTEKGADIKTNLLVELKVK